METALINMLLGMGTVFAILIIICLIITCFRIFPYLEQKKQKNATSVTDNFEQALEEEESIKAPEEDATIVAIIAAAIATATGQSTDQFIVRKIKRR